MLLLAKIISFLGGSFVKNLSGDIKEAYRLKLAAKNDEDRIRAELQIAFLEGQQNIILAEQNKWYTAMIRPAFAAIVWAFWFKLIVWDTILGLGVTGDPGEFVKWFVVLIPTSYFLVRPMEKK